MTSRVANLQQRAWRLKKFLDDEISRAQNARPCEHEHHALATQIQRRPIGDDRLAPLRPTSESPDRTCAPGFFVSRVNAARDAALGETDMKPRNDNLQSIHGRLARLPEAFARGEADARAPGLEECD